MSGKAIVYARRPGVFPADGPWRDAANRPVTALPDFADIPDPASPLDAGHPVLTVFARGADELSCVAELRRRAAEVQRLLENHHDAQRTG